MIPLVDLKAQYTSIQPELDAAVRRVMQSGQFVLGPEVAAFETAFASYCGARYGIGVNSGTSALHLALLTVGVGPGDEVITVPFTFVATVAAILYTGARPVFVDINPRSYTIDVTQIESAITSRTKAIVPVHLYGQPADLDPILGIARRCALFVIEDAAQAHGAQYKGRSVGAMGDLGCFSFYPGKNLGAYGEGGMVVTNNPDFADRVRLLRNWGEDLKYRHVVRGYNYRLDELQAAVLNAKLPHLSVWTEARRRNASVYDELLHDSGVETPIEEDYARHVYHLYVIRSKRRYALQEQFRAKEIQTGIHYPTPVHLQPAFADLGYEAGDFTHSELAASEVLSLPMYPELSLPALQGIANVISEARYVRS